MADRCPHCGAANPENLPFCNECGEPIDKNLQLIMEVQQSIQTQSSAGKSRARYDDDDDLFDEEDEVDEDGRKQFVLWAVILLFAAAAAGALFFLR